MTPTDQLHTKSCLIRRIPSSSHQSSPEFLLRTPPPSAAPSHLLPTPARFSPPPPNHHPNLSRQPPVLPPNPYAISPTQRQTGPQSPSKAHTQSQSQHNAISRSSPLRSSHHSLPPAVGPPVSRRCRSAAAHQSLPPAVGPPVSRQCSSAVCEARSQGRRRWTCVGGTVRWCLRIATCPRA